MRNDEKIDIQLEEKNSNDNLSEIELAQQNYNTALRYINIAEHMKQFEDQDKYYHRAIKYLRRSRRYLDINVRPMIRSLRKKKFAARAEGKIRLYEEACSIRDQAKTPNDYYSAETLFYRIHQYELKHAIPKRRVSEKLFEKVSKCTDSEEQAAYCAKCAKEKEAEQKRRSLFASIAFIAVVLAFLFFTRTTAFRHCLASVYSLTGDNAGAWEAYEYIYKHGGDQNTFEKYLNHRYKAAVKEKNSKDTTTACSDFRALAKENYKDSQEQLVALEKKNILATEPGEIVQYADMDWRVLDKQKDKVLLLKDNAIPSTPFHEGGGECTWESSSVRNWLNTDFLTENFLNSETDAVYQTTIVTQKNPTYQTDGGNDTTDQVFLLSAQEVVQYEATIHTTKTCWWLRTPGAAPGSMCFVYRDKTVMDYGYDTANTEITVKPAIWVNVAQ